VRAEINVVIDLYRGILGVLPDSGGFNYWLGQVRTAQCAGSTSVTNQVNTLAAAFINSAQYGNREAARPPALVQNMHVGDLYNVDVVGARAAGLRAVLLDAASLYEGVDCQRIHSLTELCELLRPTVG